MMLREELQAYLDGEIGLEELPEELRAEARAWDGLLVDVASGAPSGAPLGFDTRVMRGIESSTAAAPLPRWASWLLRPRTISVSPAGGLVVAAVIALLVVRPWTGQPVPVDPGVQPAHVYVQFSLEAPAATRVDLVGDFNEWAPTIALEDLDGDGVWTASVPLQAGVHEYMFVLDGSDWVTDPFAELHVDDGFGQENAVVAIPAINGT
jgi:Carbohydrate-binding module 48 (Isoamylase N-terminal domain)